MGTNGIGSSGPQDNFFKGPIKKISGQDSTDATEIKAGKSVQKVEFLSKQDKKQLLESSEKLADARGDDLLNREVNDEWSAIGATVKDTVEEPSIDDLSKHARAAVDQLRSISDEAVEQSQTYKSLFNLEE